MKTTRRRAALGALGASVLLLSATACSPDSDSTAETLPAAAVEDTTERAVVVPEALQFTAPLVGGGTFDGAAAAGKPTVFWFWAPT